MAITAIGNKTLVATIDQVPAASVTALGKAGAEAVTVGGPFIVNSGGITATAGGLTVTAGGATITAGDFTVSAGNVAVTVGNITVTAGNLIFAAASAKIIPGATSLLFRNNADNATNITITDAGIVTTRADIKSTGSISAGAVSTLQTGAGNGETINTAGVGVARYIAVAARTGVILQSGTYDGQTVTIINEDTTSANSITFAVVATSHVSNGVTTVINGLTGKRFVWSASAATPAWYPA